MPEAPPTSVLLPTTRWTDACEEVADQLHPGDELLLVCDCESDPVAAAAHDRAGVRVVVAGEPEGCSGKANAVAAGMEAARHDRIVWTDDDFHHPPDWLETLHADYERHGPVSELPYFVGRDPLAMLLEPLYATGGTLYIFLGNMVWAGGVVFERDDLDEDAFLRDLRRTVSDDQLLREYVDVTAVRRARPVPIGGSVRETVERHVRWMQIEWQHDKRGVLSMSVLWSVLGLSAILAPLKVAVLLTLLNLAVNETFGVRRWTSLLVYPLAIVQAPLHVYALARRTFVWGGRRYRWRGKFDVAVVE